MKPTGKGSQEDMDEEVKRSEKEPGQEKKAAGRQKGGCTEASNHLARGKHFQRVHLSNVERGAERSEARTGAWQAMIKNLDFC